MKKRLFVLLLSVVLACTAAACSCKHQWTEANCVAPKTCAVCGETEGEALGHDFVPASCAVPETCTRCSETRAEALAHEFLPATCEDPEVCIHCGKTQGEALDHTYSKWVIAEDEQTMSRQCNICHSEETLPVEYSRILKDELQGHWDLQYISQNGRDYNVYRLDHSDWGMYLNFMEGNHAVFFVDQQGYPKDVTWEFVGYEVVQDNSVYYFRIAEDGGISLNVVYMPQQDDKADIIMIDDSTSRYQFSRRNTAIAHAVEGIWVGGAGNLLYTAELSPDGTFTGYFDGQVSGTWHLRPLGYFNNGTRFCEILLRYTKDGSTQNAWGSIDLGTNDIPLEEYLERADMQTSIYLEDDGVLHDIWMEHMTEEQHAEGKQALIGSWTSTHITTQHDNSYSKVEATDYSITFAEDGTFTATLDQERSGTWRFYSAFTGNSGNEYKYLLTFHGVEDVVESFISNDTLFIYRFDNEPIFDNEPLILIYFSR